MELTSKSILKILKDVPGLKFICRNCSICDYECGWFYDQHGIFRYDSGCNCVNYTMKKPVPESNLDEFIKINKSSVGLHERIKKFFKEN